MLNFRIPRIRVHFMFFVLLGLLSVRAGMEEQSVVAGLWYAFYIVLLFLFVLLHELAHWLAAAREGVPSREILLTPIGGMAHGPPPPDSPSEIIIAAAGPAVNLAVAAWLFMLISAGGPGASNRAFSFSLADAGLLAIIFKINMFLAAFNLLPAFPMDGGRILRASLALRVGYLRATSIAVLIGAALAGAMAVYGIMQRDWLLALIALYLFVQGQIEKKAALAAAQLRRDGDAQWLPTAWNDAPFEEHSARDDAALAGAQPARGWLARALDRWRANADARRGVRETEMRDKVDKLLDKIRASGIASLTPEERRFLQRASRHYRQPPA